MANQRAKQRLMAKKARTAEKKRRSTTKANVKVSDPGKKARKAVKDVKNEDTSDIPDDRSSQLGSSEIYPEEDEVLDIGSSDREGTKVDEEEDELANDWLQIAFKITYLVPKGSSRICKPLELSSLTGWSTFKTRVAHLMGVDRLELSLSYQFSNAKSGSLFCTLETLDEYKRLIKDFGMLLKTPSKRKSPLTVQIKSQVEPDSKAKAGTSKKSTSKAVSDGESGDDVPTPVWKIVGELRDKYTACETHPGTVCYLMGNGEHRDLSVADLTTWATVISHHKATLDEPPAQLKLADRPPRTRGTSPTKSVAPPAVAAPVAGFDPTAIVAMVTAITAGLAQVKGGVPAQPAPEPVVERQVVPSGDEQLVLDEGLEYPTIREWLESIVDVQPRLKTYADALEGQGLVRLSDIGNSDLTVPILMQSTGMRFVDASAFIRMGRAALKEFQAAIKG
ncbi:hypothetical protein FRC07_013108 [Ceratobasidium sp. 392]|nr:hypothetical protein FRC07_013108 [Ceratobasidium sp. 392]